MPDQRRRERGKTATYELPLDESWTIRVSQMKWCHTLALNFKTVSYLSTILIKTLILLDN